MKTYLFHGPSGSGKDTQIELLNKKFNNRFEVIGTGDMFRYYYEKKTEEGLKAYEYWNKGLWVPDEMVHSLLAEWVKRYDEKKDWIFVSAIRRDAQIPLFEEMLTKKGRKLDCFVSLQLSDEVAIERMSKRWYCKICGATYHEIYKPEKDKGFCDNEKCVINGKKSKLYKRDDDQPDKIITRLDENRKTIGAIEDYYEKIGKLIKINADDTIENINKDIIEKLNL